MVVLDSGPGGQGGVGLQVHQLQAGLVQGGLAGRVQLQVEQYGQQGGLGHSPSPTALGMSFADPPEPGDGECHSFTSILQLFKMKNKNFSLKTRFSRPYHA